MRLVIALGGNALLKKGEKPTFDTQERNVTKAIKALAPVIKKNDVVITHGNGPQVGYLLMQQNAPLDILDAETGGQIGYMIQQKLHNVLRNREVITLITQVLVDKNDSGFKNPTKFIGPFYTKLEADRLKNDFKIKKDSDRGYRRVVASPNPIKIIESESVNNLLKQKAVVIAAGGGGIPVIYKNGKLEGAEAVIDKDLASACVANSTGAEVFIMVTDVDRAYLSYNSSDEKGLDKISLKEIKKLYKEGHFPPGSMGPKIQAAINFLEKRRGKVIITNIENITKALVGKSGTTITR